MRLTFHTTRRRRTTGDAAAAATDNDTKKKEEKSLKQRKYSENCIFSKFSILERPIVFTCGFCAAQAQYYENKTNWMGPCVCSSQRTDKASLSEKKREKIKMETRHRSINSIKMIYCLLRCSMKRLWQCDGIKTFSFINRIHRNAIFFFSSLLGFIIHLLFAESNTTSL